MAVLKNIKLELLEIVRSSRLVRVLTTQIRVATKKAISRDSIIINSSIPGLDCIGISSLISNSSISGNVEIGENCSIFNYTLAGNIKIGDYSTLNGKGRALTDSHSINIGKFCSIAPGCYFQTYNHRSDQLSSFYMNKNIFSTNGSGNIWRYGSNESDSISKGNIDIENDVWIGTNATILTGVRIGNGAIVGANSLVNKDVPPYAIVGGVPAVVIGFRFSKEEINNLLEIEWWNWSVDRILELHYIFAGKLDLEKIKKAVSPCL